MAPGSAGVCWTPFAVVRNDNYPKRRLLTRSLGITRGHRICLPPSRVREDARNNVRAGLFWRFPAFCTATNHVVRIRSTFFFLQSSGGVRPPCGAPVNDFENAPAEEERRCDACSKKCASHAMWICTSGKELCKGMMFHRNCLARGKGACRKGREECPAYVGFGKGKEGGREGRGGYFFC